MRLAEAVELYIQDRGPSYVDGDRQLRYYQKSYNRILGDLDVAQFGQPQVDFYIRSRFAEGRAASTIRTEWMTLKTILRWCALKGYRGPVPYLSGVAGRAATRSRVLSQDEARRLFEAAKPLWLKNFIAIGLLTGARRAAICSLTWDRIDFENKTIDFRTGTYFDRRRKRRTVVPMVDALATFLASSMEAADPLADQRVCEMSSMTLYTHFRYAVRDAGLGPDVVPMTLRHTAASMLVTKAPLLQASRILGHSSIHITEQVYVHLLAENLRPAANALDDLLVLS